MGRPAFTGIMTHRDPLGRFAVHYPTEWQTFDIKEGEVSARGVAAREGIGFAPDAADPATVFSVWVSPLEHAAAAEDLDDIRQGVDAGLQALDGCVVEEAADTLLSNLIKLERVYTFRETGCAAGTGAAAPAASDAAAVAVRKRKQWLLYADTWLICLTWQGSSPERYAYWLAMANQSFLTFEIPPALWFATDREVQASLAAGQPPAATTGG